MRRTEPSSLRSRSCATRPTHQRLRTRSSTSSNVGGSMQTRRHHLPPSLLGDSCTTHTSTPKNSGSRSKKHGSERRTRYSFPRRT
ncbi:hypothetical protein ACFPRL_27550 [Pseudoclavibacter helvolus]